jgi:hypothetical protein
MREAELLGRYFHTASPGSSIRRRVATQRRCAQCPAQEVGPSHAADEMEVTWVTRAAIATTAVTKATVTAIRRACSGAARSPAAIFK